MTGSAFQRGYVWGDHKPRLLIEFVYNLKTILTLTMNSTVIPIREQICQWRKP